MPRKPTILFVAEAGDSTCAYYRAYLPTLGLRKLGYQADMCSTLMERDDGRWTGLVNPDGRQVLAFDPPPDVLIVRKMIAPDGNMTAGTGMYRQCREHGQRIFIDLDDDPWNLPRWNPAYGNTSAEQLRAWELDMESATGVICSTPALADAVREHTGADVFVCRNGVDPTIYTESMKQHSPLRPLRLGWLGLMSFRGVDLEPVVPALKEVLANRMGEVEFWHLGARPDEISVRELLGSDFPVQIVERPWVTITELPSALAQIDVAIVPMHGGLFSEARSSVTGLALAAAGVPFASSATAEYRRLFDSFQTGYPVWNLDQWPQALRVLVDAERYEYRQSMRGAGWMAARKHDLLNTARQYSQVLESVNA